MAEEKLISSKLKMRVFVMRHSIRSDGNNKPESNCSITKEGEVLVDQTVATLCEKHTRNLTKIYASPYARCQETAARVLLSCDSKNIPIITSCDLAETLTIGHNNYHHVQLPAGLVLLLKENGIELPEADEHVAARCKHFIQQLEKNPTPDDVLVVSHAGLIHELFHQMNPKHTSPPLGYCGMACAMFEDGVWTISPI